MLVQIPGEHHSSRNCVCSSLRPTPFFKKLRLLFSSPRYSTKLRDEIIFIMKLTSDLSGITLKSFKLSPLCQTVSYAAERSMSTTPRFSLH